MRARIRAVMILLFAVFSALTQAQVIVTDDANTSSLFAKTNFGDSIALIVCSGSNTYIKFSMANLGPGITSSNVSKATLVLYVDAVLTSGTVDVYQVNGSWSEGSITYNNAPTLGAKLFSAVPVTKPGFLSLDMTSSVQAWLAGSLTNNGIALVPTTGSAISASFDSKENIFTSHPADLDLVLVSAGPRGPQGQTGATGPAGPIGPNGANGAPGSAGGQGIQGIAGPVGQTGATGPQGPQGPTGAGFNFRTAFDNSVSYATNDVVTYNGSSYVATASTAGPNNPTPDSNTTAWSLMAAQGAAGTAGAAGVPGQQGPQGPPGSPGSNGAQGLAGPTGPPGAPGLIGATGMTGATGATGAQGPPGPVLPDLVYTDQSNTFSSNQTMQGNVALAPTGTATGSQGYVSNPLDLQASAFDGSNPQQQVFRWQAEPAGNNSATASGTLNLLFGGNGAKPAETGLSVAPTGIVTFAPGQTFPGAGGGTITNVSAGSGLSGGGNAGSVTLGLAPNSCGAGSALTGLPFTCSTFATTGANTLTGNQAVTGAVTASGAVSGSTINTSSTYYVNGVAFDFGNATLFDAYLGFSGNPATTGTYNTASGWAALYANTTGSYNTASGAQALESNTTGIVNTASGGDALAANTTGGNNTASGALALTGNTMGNDNTASGVNALGTNTTGSDNVGLGWGAGNPTNYQPTTGSNNTYVGFLSNPGTQLDLSNATAVGANAQVTASNALVLGSIAGVNRATASVNVGIGTSSPISRLEVHDTLASTNSHLVTLTNGGGFSGAGASIDFNTYLPLAGTYNPSAEISAIDQNNYSDDLVFSANKPGAGNSGLVENMRITSTGSVGIGTATPQYTLDVNGTARYTGLVTFAPGQTFPGTPLLAASNNFIGDETISGNVGIGTVTPSSPLTVVTSNTFLPAFFQSSSGFGTWMELNNTSAGGHKWAILSAGAGNAEGAGNLGITDFTGKSTIWLEGTVNAGSIVTAGTVNAGSIVTGSTAINNMGCNAAFGGIGFGPYGSIGCANYSLLGEGVNTYLNRPAGGAVLFREGNASQMVLASGGNFGIGTTAPQYPLHVNGIMRSETGLSLGGNASVAVDAPGVVGGHFTVLANGNVGIDNANPTANLDVGGSVRISGDVPMNSNPRMSFSGFMPGNLGNGPRGGYFIPDRNITITRITASENSGGHDCNTTAQAVLLVRGGGGGVLYSLDLGDNAAFVDSGSIQVSVAAGTAFYIYASPASNCNIGGSSPSDVNINVQYLMQ